MNPSTAPPFLTQEFHGRLGSSSHFTALQPLLSTAYTHLQIKGLLTLSLLFWQKPTFTDTQLGDSPQLYNEFIDPGRELIAPLVKSALHDGEARLLLRDAFYLTPDKALFECKSLTDVYKGWQAQNLPGAWVVPPTAPNRRRFVEYWEALIPEENILTYKYLNVKRRFQNQARLSPDWKEIESEVGPEVVSQLLAVIASPWFSHSKVFATLQAAGLANAACAQVFGLLDESAYADELGHGLAFHGLTEPLIRSGPVESDPATEHIERVVAESFRTVDAPDLALLGMLRFDEILRIRELGKFLIDHVKILDAKQSLTDEELRSLALALGDYWRVICQELARMHPGASTKATAIGLAVGQHTPTIFAEGMSVVLSGLATLLTGTGMGVGVAVEGQTNVVRRLIDALSFRFIFKGDSSEMSRLREVFSRSNVLAANNRVVLSWT